MGTASVGTATQTTGARFTQREIAMRTIIIAAAGLAALSIGSTPVLADGAWCARDTKGGTNCGFHTFAQCQADISGIGGSCSPNPFFLGANGGDFAYSASPRRRARGW
jgi:hypothetical protein